MADEILIGGINAPQPILPAIPKPSVQQPEEAGLSFKDYLANSISEIQQLQTAADETIGKLITGEITNVSEAMVAIEKANAAFLTLLQVRNKIISAYDQIQRMQV
ncbi:MAG: flagellar hook-basal body complex protein FliE [Candidatus Abyssobacteria bacterium SURF_5]|uniref:Flagellar hook-basal body complex protein FliE n=1 Tax=Abyssobacteria bacterium (strain SURF_5) TaxID=2093360 RepID=A0A3A4NDU9_ABYX5|nr:MAG: flagellar hook-basal body complex protein FliE [Candidatus Abyssubacteria bacterium SURF_5]